MLQLRQNQATAPPTAVTAPPQVSVAAPPPITPVARRRSVTCRWRRTQNISLSLAIAATVAEICRVVGASASIENIYGVSLPPSAVVISRQADIFLDGEAVVRLPTRDLNALIAQLKPGICGTTGAASFGFPPHIPWKKFEDGHRKFLCDNRPDGALGSRALLVDVAPERMGNVEVRLTTRLND